MAGRQKKFQWRAFTTFSIVCAFVVILFSGTILYVAPPGRIANWSGWSIVALTKSQWQSVHTIFSTLFIVIAFFHLYFNWRVILTYLRRRMSEGMDKRRELAVSGILGLGVFVLVLLDAPPFSTVMDFGEQLKNSWGTRQTEPPRPHAELLTLTDFAGTIQMPSGELLRLLDGTSLKPDSMQMTVGALADKYGISPQELYARINVQMVGRTVTTGSGGYGRRTVAEVCEQIGVPVDASILRLRENGVEATGGSSLRDLALQYKMTPREIADMIYPDGAR